MTKRVDLAAELRAMQSEGQGLWRLAVFDCRGLVELSRTPWASLDASSRAVLETVRRVLAGEVSECLLCGHPFALFRRMPLDIVVMSAMVDGPSSAFSFCICEGCHEEDRGVMASVVMAFMKEHIVTDMRVLPPFHDAGRA